LAEPLIGILRKYDNMGGKNGTCNQRKNVKTKNVWADNVVEIREKHTKNMSTVVTVENNRSSVLWLYRYAKYVP